MVSSEPRSIEYLINESTAKKDDIIDMTRRLIDSGRLTLDALGRIHIKN